MIQFLLVFSDWALIALRVVLGLIMISHGWPKVKNIKNNNDLNEVDLESKNFWNVVTAFLEFVGGLFILFGLLTQLVAVLFFVEIMALLATVKKDEDFVGGVEFELLLLAGMFILITMGGGSFSVDGILRLLIY